MLVENCRRSKLPITLHLVLMVQLTRVLVMFFSRYWVQYHLKVPFASIYILLIL